MLSSDGTLISASAAPTAGSKHRKPNPSLYTQKLGLNLDISNTTCLPQDLLGLPRHTGDLWSNVLHAWLKLRSKSNKNEDDLHQLNMTFALWNDNNFQFKNKNLLFKEWIEAGIHKIRGKLNERKKIMPFADLLNILPAAPQRTFEYNAFKTAFEQACKRNRIDLYHRLETGLQHMTIQDKLVVTLGVKDISLPKKYSRSRDFGNTI